VDTRKRVVAGRYRLLEPLGSGGMGTVWRAEDLVLGRSVAVKEVTFPHGLSDDDRDVLRERTRREARAAARLDHPSAVTVFDVVEEDDVPYLVMELVEARTLADVVRTDGPLTPQRAAEVGLALLGALEAAHRQGIVHRDVKPSNVLVRDDGRVVLTDFGIASTTGDSSITSTGLLLGSPAYIAPERARGESPGPPADLWSLGATLFTAVEGRPPFEGDQPLTTVTAVVTGAHAPFTAAGPLEPVLAGLLEKDPTARLDAAGARRLLTPLASRPAAPAPTRSLPTPVAANADAGARTSALDAGAVRDDVDAARSRTALPPRRPAPAADGDDRRRGGRLALAGAGALAVLAAGVAVATMTGDDPDRAAAPPAQTSAPEPSSAAPAADPADEPADGPADGQVDEPAQEPEGEDPAQPGAVPAGWSTDTGGDGWTVALPPGYAQTRPGEYRHADTGRTLRVDTGPGQPDAVADREAQAEDFARRHPSYQEIRIESVDYRGYEAADWEFTYEGLHVLNRVFVVDGTGHSLFLQTPRRDVDGAREDFKGIVQAFRPAGA
jgi:hypothetical protein